jgi:hypothetical protein
MSGIGPGPDSVSGHGLDRGMISALLPPPEGGGPQPKTLMESSKATTTAISPGWSSGRSRSIIGPRPQAGYENNRPIGCLHSRKDEPQVGYDKSMMRLLFSARRP